MNFTTRSARFIERSDGSIVLSNAIGLASVSTTMVRELHLQVIIGSLGEPSLGNACA